MKRGGGFTLIELLITITIMTILMTLAVINGLTSQVDGRDKERDTDVTAIARSLEVYYSSGNPYTSAPKGYYPGGSEITTAAATSPPFKNLLEGLDTDNLIAPKRTISTSFGIDTGYASSSPGSNADGSYTDAQARTYLASYPYLYQPINRSNTFCTTYTSCVRFNLYYINERNNTVIRFRSKNQ